MGTFCVTCRIENITDPATSAAVEKLPVDAGSDYTWLPAKVLEKLTVGREKKDVTMTMPDGQFVTRGVGFAVIRVGEFFTVDEVVFAEPGDLPVLGARTLSGFNVRVDEEQQKLIAAGPIAAASVN